MNLSKWLPFENYILLTPLSPAEICNRLLQHVEPRKTFRMFVFSSKTSKDYEGEVFANGFSISRIIGYRNSFLPEINGKLSTVAGQTEVHVKMQPSIEVIIFMCLWLGVTGMFCLGIIAAGILTFNKTQHHFSKSALLPFGMFAFGWLLIFFGFKGESRVSKKFLASILNGHEPVPH